MVSWFRFFFPSPYLLEIRTKIFTDEMKQYLGNMSNCFRKSGVGVEMNPRLAKADRPLWKLGDRHVEIHSGLSTFVYECES